VRIALTDHHAGLENLSTVTHNPNVKLAPPELSENEALAQIAKKVIWWKPPAEALTDPVRFAAQVMTFADWEDVQTVRRQLGDALFRKTLAETPPGVFDEASWVYWHNVFGISPVPPLPKRNLC